MDAFKAMEIERMRLGGNRTWKDFFGGAEGNVVMGITWVLLFFYALGMGV
jgi:ADP-ribosylation factor GTPase-activating protein 1